MSTYDFLSAEWIDAALAVRDEFADQLPEPPAIVRMNLVVTAVPPSGDEIAASVDTGANGLLPMLGHLDDPELTITLEYEVAKSLFVGQDAEAVGKAFFGGRIRIDGDMTRLFLLQSLQPTSEQRAVANQVNSRLLAITT